MSISCLLRTAMSYFRLCSLAAAGCPIDFSNINSMYLMCKNQRLLIIPDKKELGFVGVPKNINVDIIQDILVQNKIPIVAPLGLDDNNQTYNI